MPYEPITGNMAYAARGTVNHRNDEPAGAFFALIAANRGWPVAICTDTNHHDDWLVTLLDQLAQHPNKIIKSRELGRFMPASTTIISSTATLQVGVSSTTYGIQPMKRPPTKMPQPRKSCSHKARIL